MERDFRCERCDRMIRVESDATGKVRCPLCGKATTVPAGLAAMPQPLVEANAGWPIDTSPPPQTPALPEGGPDAHEEATLAVMARTMPWLVSVFLHVALGLVLLFLVVIVLPGQIDTTRIVVPSAHLTDAPGGRVGLMDTPTKLSKRLALKAASEKYRNKDLDSSRLADSHSTKNRIKIYAPGGSDGGGRVAGLDGGAGSRVRFIGSDGGNVHHICYVLDRSGSMMDTLDMVKRECARSVGHLKLVQDYHVILFSDGPPLEAAAKRLVPATEANNRRLAGFLAKPRALAQTDPIPALERAFAVLAKADPKRPGKLIYLLTDGVFPDNDKVLRTIRTLNAKGRNDVRINTILYGNRPPVAERVLKTIAAENGGQYTLVRPDR